MPTGTAEDYELHELGFISELNDNDLLLIEDVSTPLPLKKIRLSTLRSAFTGGWPSLDDVPEGALTPPNFTLRGVEGGWIIRIGGNVIAETDWYFIHKLDLDSGEYVPIYAIPESRDQYSYGEKKKKALIYEHFVEETDPPTRHYGSFKLQAVSHEFRGSLSDEKSAWTLYDLPSDWYPDAPTLLTTGGYPLISYGLLPTGTIGYTISIKIEAPDGQKNLIGEYKIGRACDEGTGSFAGKPKKWAVMSITGSPQPKIVIWHDPDASFVPGYKYRYNVLARAISPNNNLGRDLSNTQEITLTDDSTPPDDPVFSVVVSPGNIEVNFDPIEVGGDPDVGWSHILLQYRIDDGEWVEVRLDKTLSFVFSVAEADYANAYDFQAKVVDYAGNENEGGWQLDDGGYTAGKVTELCFGTTLQNKITQITTNEGNITTHETEISQNATAIALRATTTYVDGEVVTLEGLITVNAGNIVLRVSKNDVINQINISTEEIAISGRTVVSAGSGARIMFFPDALTDGYIGLQVIDDAAADVLKVMVGGADVGDVIIGASAGKHLKFDKSAGTLCFDGTFAANIITASAIAAGTLTATEINANAQIGGNRIKITATTVFDADVIIKGILTAGGGIKTSAAGNDRIEIGGSSEESIRFYQGGTLRGRIRVENAVVQYKADDGSYRVKMIPDEFNIERVSDNHDMILLRVEKIANPYGVLSVHDGAGSQVFSTNWGGKGIVGCTNGYKVGNILVLDGQAVHVSDPAAIHASNGGDAADLADVQLLRTTVEDIIHAIEGNKIMITS